MNEIMTIQNVRGYCDDQGTAWLNAADVARGLGWTQTKNSVEYIKWERLNGFLRDCGFPQNVGKDDFIPENIFYRLVWKSRDERALEFQAKVADEILPTIRKHGAYMTPDTIERILSDPDTIIELATRLKAEREKNAVLKTQVAELQPKASYYDRVLQCPDLVCTSAIAKDYGTSCVVFNQLLHSLGVQYKQGDIWLLYQKYACLGWTKTKTHVYTDKYGQEHCRVHTYWTQKGRLGLYELLKLNGHLPLIEQ